MTDHIFLDGYSPDIPKTVKNACLGNTQLTVYLMPDDGYRISTSEAVDCIFEKQQSMTGFLKSAMLRKLRGESPGYSYPESIQRPSNQQGSKIEYLKVIRLDIAVLYWLYMWRNKSNQHACNLISALVEESLERHFDPLFEAVESENIYLQRTTERITDYKRALGPVKRRFSDYNILSGI